MGACLARSGAAVTMVVRAAALANYPQQLQLESPFGNFTVPVAASAEVPACDVLWLTVKATQLEESLAAVKNPEAVGAIVPLLNGIDHLAFLRAAIWLRACDSSNHRGRIGASRAGAHYPPLIVCAPECVIVGASASSFHAG